MPKNEWIGTERECKTGGILPIREWATVRSSHDGLTYTFGKGESIMFRKILVVILFALSAMLTVGCEREVAKCTGEGMNRKCGISHNWVP
jgi:hypothetical protein